MKYYHYLNNNNLEDIFDNEILEDRGMGVYVCDNVDDLLKFINLYIRTGMIKKEDTTVIEFDTDEEFEESFDHNAELLDGARAYVHFGNVSICNIESYSLR
jgi:hypothetical protein